MKKPSAKFSRGFTLIGLLVVIVVLGIFFALLVTYLSKAKARSIRMCCVNSLKESQLSFYIWANDHGGSFPMEVPKDKGGTLGWPPEGNDFRIFQVMSNELSTPHTAYCVADTRQIATNFQDFNNQNISFFVNLDASQTNHDAWLCGDRNITNQLSPKQSVLTVQKDQSPGWTETMHNNWGNVALVCGSVEQWSTKDLHKTMKQANWTNRLVLPE
jgi:type II secretory pathway pseudopilin PulG